MSKRVGKDGVFLGLAGLLLGIYLGLRPWEIPRASHAGPWKIPSILNKNTFPFSQFFTPRVNQFKFYNLPKIVLNEAWGFFFAI